MKRIKLSFVILIVIIFAQLVAVGCSPEADVASRNLSTAADMFQIDRRIVFYNGITGQYMLTIEGKCSLGNYDDYRELTVTCKTGPDVYKKHFLGLSDNVTYFAEQVESVGVSVYRYKVIFNPGTLIPEIELAK